MEKIKLTPAKFSDELCNRVDPLVSLILSVNLNKIKDDIIMVPYPDDVITWANYGLALQLAGLSGKKLYIFNPDFCFKHFWKIRRDSKKAKMIFSYKKRFKIKHTFLYAEMAHNISYYSRHTQNNTSDLFMLLPHDYLTVAVIASYYGCPEEYNVQEQIDWFKPMYEKENVIHVESV